MTATFDAFDLLPAQIAVLDRKGDITFTNQSWKQTAAHGLAGRRWNYIDECEATAARGCPDGALIGEAIAEILRGERVEFVATYSCPFDRRHHWFQISVRRARESDEGMGAVVMHTNVTALQTDHLTGLPNRALFEAQSQYMLELARQSSLTLGVALIDLDGFKAINDEFGHAAGDKVLVELAQRLSPAAKEDELLARLGGDEFGVITGVGGTELSLVRLTRDLQLAFKTPYPVRGMLRYLSASIGVALFPDDGKTLKLLLESADSRMYSGKRAHKRAREKWIA